MTQLASSRLQDSNVERSWKLLQKTHGGWAERSWWTSFQHRTFSHIMLILFFPSHWALSIYQKLWETSMERSIEWRTCSIWHKFHFFMLSSPKFKIATHILPWIAWNRWFLLKTRKWNMHFQWKVSNYLFKIPLIPGNFSVERTENVCPINIPTRNFQNFSVNGKCPLFSWCPYYLRAWNRRWPTLLLQFQYSAHILCTPLQVHANYNNNNTNQKSPTVYTL